MVHCDGELNRSLLQSITGMRNGRGMIKKEDFVRLVKEYCGQFNNDSVITRLPDMAVLRIYRSASWF